MISQCFEFYESVITENNLIITFVAQRLAESPDIQQRLYDEMHKIHRHIGGNDLTYNDVAGNMKYAEMVINESLRMCMIAPELRRRATKSFVLMNFDGDKIEIKPGDAIWLPSFILQNDPQYWGENVNKFDPERFSAENKHLIRTGTYAPFGIGPRKMMFDQCNASIVIEFVRIFNSFLFCFVFKGIALVASMQWWKSKFYFIIC